MKYKYHFLFLSFLLMCFGLSLHTNPVKVGGTPKLTVSQGGTGASSFTEGECLIGHGTSSITSSTCGSGGGGSGGGTWSTTTSQVSGRLINYPNNSSTDVVTIGSNSTTSAEYYFDPTALKAKISGAINLPNFLSGGLGVSSAGDVYKYATTTFSGNLVYTNGNVTLSTSTLNLTTSAFASPNISQWTNNSGYLSSVDISANTNLSAGSGITLTGDALTCDVASGSVSGCLSNTDWSTFNGKESALSFTYPLSRSANTISLAFGTTTANIWSAGNIFQASSTMQYLTSYLATSTQASSTDLYSLRATLGTFNGTSGTTSNLGITGALTFNGVTASTWSAFCTTITGSSALCDGNDATGSGDPFAWTPHAGYNSTSTLLSLGGGAMSTASSTFAKLSSDISTSTSATSTDFYSLRGLIPTFSYTNATGTNLNLTSLLTSVSGIFSSLLTIPQGSNPTVDTIGEIALDTTDSQLLISTSTGATPAVLRTNQPIFRFSVASTSMAYASSSMLLPTDIRGFTATGASCFVEAGTSVVINLSDANGTNDTNTITCTTSKPTSATAFTSNNVWTSGEEVRLEWGTKTGTVDWVHVTIYGTWTRT